MQTYDTEHFDPPAPVVRVTLRDPESGMTASEVLLLIDTGADVTLLPASRVQSIGIPILAGQEYQLISFDGSTSIAPAVSLDLILLGRAFRGRYLLIDDAPGIQGRDILNHLLITLDGPRRRWAEGTAEKSSDA